MKKYFLLILISFLSYANVFSQTAIDSALNNMNVDSIHDSTKFTSFTELHLLSLMKIQIQAINY
jgi:hypothetical protein